MVDAIDQGRLADPDEDTGYAFLVAAEIADRGGDLANAAALAGRAVEAYRARGVLDDCYPRTFRAEILLRLGREDEAMAEFTALRPKMSEDDEALSYISEALETGGRAEIAEQWVTEALHTALQRRQQLESEHWCPDYKQAASMVIDLAQRRYWLRRELGLPHDEHDHFAARLLGCRPDN